MPRLDVVSPLKLAPGASASGALFAAKQHINVGRAADAKVRIADLAAWIESEARAGKPCPSNVQVGARYGITSTGTAAKWITRAEQAGLVVITRGAYSRIAAAPDGAWRTAEGVRTQPTPMAPKSPHAGAKAAYDPGRTKRNPFLTPAQQENVDKRRSETARLFSPHAKRCAKAGRVTDDEAARLVAEAIAAGRVTQCPPMAVAAVNNGTGFGA